MGRTSRFKIAEQAKLAYCYSRRMPSSGMLRRVALVSIDVSEKCIASITRVTRIGELGTLAITSNRLSLMLDIFKVGLYFNELRQNMFLSMDVTCHSSN
jgi:hypothetical protein